MPGAAGAAGAGGDGFFAGIDLRWWRPAPPSCSDGGWFPLAMGALLRADEHLAARPAQLLAAHPQRRAAAAGLRAPAWPAGPAPRAAHRGLRRGRPRHGAAGAAAQPEAQPGAARAQPHPHRGFRRGAAGADCAAHAGAAAGPGLLARGACASASWKRPTCRARWAARPGAGGATLRDQLLPQPRDLRAHAPARAWRCGANGCLPP
jgi:hypothetical protein